MSRLPHVVILFALGAIAYFGYRWYVASDDERRIRAALDDLAVTVGESGEDGLAQMTRAARLGRFFTPDVVVDLGPPYMPVQGRDTIMAMAAKAQVPGGGLDVRFVDVSIDVAPSGEAAVARLTATVRSRDGTVGSGLDAKELEMAWRKLDGEWLIERVTGIETLERPR